jgi:hypothetical protein
MPFRVTSRVLSVVARRSLRYASVGSAHVTCLARSTPLNLREGVF